MYSNSNGDIEVGLSKAEELPYVMGLVRQAFEKQMGNGVRLESSYNMNDSSLYMNHEVGPP